MSVPDELLDWVKARGLLLAVTCLAGGWGLVAWFDRPLHPLPGVLAPEEPLQGPVGEGASWAFRGHRIVPLADFEIRARVLGAERYRWDAGAKLSPLDLALGWGRMSDSAVLARIAVDQSDRWYHWLSSSQPPIPVEEIITHSANMHMIPATPAVERALKGFRVGQVVSLKGRLVRVEGPGGFRWASSTTRADSGDGSCELVWVEEAGP